MSRVRIFLEVEVRDALMWGEGGPDADALRWFENEVLGDVILHSNEISGEVGAARVMAWDRPGTKPTPVPKTMKRLKKRDANGGER